MALSEFGACTVVTKSHLAYARVLATSFRRHHPDVPFFVVLADRVDGCFDPRNEPFELFTLEQIGIPDLVRLCFQYTAFELSCAAKCHALRFLFERGFTTLVYLDADVLVLGPFSELMEVTDRHSVVLTPHMLHTIPEDGRRPSERDLLSTGTFNGGLFAVRRDNTGRSFLGWLAERLRRNGLVDTANGLYCDQLWLNLTPGLFENVHLLRHEGYNVGYWRLTAQQIEHDGGQLSINGTPVRCFHFSGLPLDDVRRVSRYQDRLTLDDIPALKPLFESYRSEVVGCGHGMTASWPYAFGSFDNGAPVPQEARRLFWSLDDSVERFGNPFDTTRPESFWRFLNEETHPGSEVSRFWYHVYLGRPDLQAAWPDVLNADASAYRTWVQQHGREEISATSSLSLPRESCPSATRTSKAGRAGDIGVNLIGHAASEKGVGEGLRATARALAAAAIPHCVVDYVDPGSSNTDRTLVRRVRHYPFATNIIQINAEGFPHFADRHGSRALRGKYNIGIWAWELADFPEVFHRSFHYVNEVWVPSTFCLDAISRAAAIPVVRMPHALPDEIETAGVTRAHFGLPESACVFLFIFDVDSVIERKNPVAAIRAFRQAFSPADHATLVLKVVHGTRPVREMLEREAGDASVIILDRVLPREELNSLIEMSDCYVSLHRTEGFGLTIAEAMALGKPVVATGYSGNEDFMHVGNSYPVSYRLVPLHRDFGPYPRGSMWAEPDVNHASALMRIVYDVPEQAREIGARARADVARMLSPAVVGAQVKARLELIAGLT